jgi:glycosyltransferase involved in cell wall biosynthesis
MKVLHVLNELKHSGAEVMLQLAYKKFERSGIDSHILSTGDQIGEYAVTLQQTGYKVHHIPFLRSPGFFADLRTLLKKEKFKAVHIHTERAFIWYVLLAKLSHVPTVVRTFHSIFLFPSYLRLKRKLQRKLSSKLFRAIHTAVSDSVVAVEKERFNNDCVLIRNWTDVQKFRPPTEKERTEARRLYKIAEDDFSIVTVGACTPIKNHFAVLSAVTKANNLLKGKKIVLLHVGTGPSLGEEQSYVIQNGMEEQCRFIGIMNDVRPCLHAADAFVMTSRGEGLGMAAVEAMSTGLPAILYDVYGLRDLLPNGGSGGLLIETKEECLVAALLSLVSSPEMTRAKASEARQMIVGAYSLEEPVDKFIRLYTSGRLPVAEWQDEINRNSSEEDVSFS